MKKIQMFSLGVLVIILSGCGGAIKKWKESKYENSLLLYK